MRTPILPALLALGLLAGCNSPQPPKPKAPKIANSVSGTILLREPRALGNNTKAEIKVVDAGQSSNVLAQTTIEHANKPPISFNLPIDPAQVNPRRTYAVEAKLIDGERRYLPVLQYPVLTRGAPSQVQITVAPEPTPSEKLYEAYKKAYAQIGSLKSVNGSALKEHSSVAWDAFYTNGKIVVVREITDLDNNQGHIVMHMAYKDGKPWVVVKQESADENSRPFATTKVGWDENGNLVLKDKLSNGQTSEVSDDEAKQLRADAEDALKAAEAKLPKH